MCVCTIVIRPFKGKQQKRRNVPFFLVSRLQRTIIALEHRLQGSAVPSPSQTSALISPDHSNIKFTIIIISIIMKTPSRSDIKSMKSPVAAVRFPPLKSGPKCRRCIRFDASPNGATFKSAGDSINFIESLMQEIRIQDHMRWPFLQSLESKIAAASQPAGCEGMESVPPVHASS